MVEKVKRFLDNKITFSSNEIISYFENNLTIEKAVDQYENILFNLQKPLIQPQSNSHNK